MFVTIAAVSGMLLVSLLGVKSWELARGQTFLSGPRIRANNALVSFVIWVSRNVRSSTDFVRREIALKGLHIIAYLALIGVRGIERKLERLTFLVRRLRRNRYQKPVHRTPEVTEQGGGKAEERT